MKSNIPNKYSIDKPIEHRTYLINGKIGTWNGDVVDVVSTLFTIALTFFLFQRNPL